MALRDDASGVMSVAKVTWMNMSIGIIRYA